MRPFVKVYQRHPSTELSEVQKIMRASTSLHMSVEESQRNLKLLKDRFQKKVNACKLDDIEVSLHKCSVAFER